jgi:predicted O-methyltransferase YrrM
MPTARSAIRAVLMMGGWLIAALVVLEARSARAIADLRAMNHKRLLEAAVEEHAQKLQAQASELARLRATGGRRRSVDLTPPQGVKPIRTFKFKGELPTILQEEQLRVGVEVGVFTGGFSRWVLEQWPMCTSYSMVDLWAPQEHYRQMDSASLEENLRRMELARRNVEPFAGKATLIRNSSVAAAASFADASVDFVYLDARHTYDAVTEDLEAWWPKLRPGGILAGEDYMDADEVWQATATCNFSVRTVIAGVDRPTPPPLPPPLLASVRPFLADHAPNANP